jgi:hypothetical protein
MAEEVQANEHYTCQVCGVFDGSKEAKRRRKDTKVVCVVRQDQPFYADAKLPVTPAGSVLSGEFSHSCYREVTLLEGNFSNDPRCYILYEFKDFVEGWAKNNSLPKDSVVLVDIWCRSCYQPTNVVDAAMQLCETESKINNLHKKRKRLLEDFDELKRNISSVEGEIQKATKRQRVQRETLDTFTINKQQEAAGV